MFPSNLNVEILGKQNSLFLKRPVIKCVLLHEAEQNIVACQRRAAQSNTKVERGGISMQDINTNKSKNLNETEINNCFVTEFVFRN